MKSSSNSNIPKRFFIWLKTQLEMVGYTLYLEVCVVYVFKNQGGSSWLRERERKHALAIDLAALVGTMFVDTTWCIFGSPRLSSRKPSIATSPPHSDYHHS